MTAAGRLPVLLTAGAERDLEAIYDFVADADSELKARRLLDRLLERIETLSQVPERGAVPRELLALGIDDYRQVVSKPYRIIYRVFVDAVIVYVVADGQRDMQTLLARRLLGAD